MISLRLSVSTSFMLAALRVLHIDTSHAPATGPSIEEWPFMAYQLVMSCRTRTRHTYDGTR